MDDLMSKRRSAVAANLRHVRTPVARGRLRTYFAPEMQEEIAGAALDGADVPVSTELRPAAAQP